MASAVHVVAADNVPAAKFRRVDGTRLPWHASMASEWPCGRRSRKTFARIKDIIMWPMVSKVLWVKAKAKAKAEEAG